MQFHSPLESIEENRTLPRYANESDFNGTKATLGLLFYEKEIIFCTLHKLIFEDEEQLV